MCRISQAFMNHDVLLTLEILRTWGGACVSWEVQGWCLLSLDSLLHKPYPMAAVNHGSIF